MSTVSSATAPSVGPSYVPTSSSLWNNRIVIIGGLAACAGLILLFLARRYFSGSKDIQSKPTALESKPTGAGIVIMSTHTSSVPYLLDRPLFIEHSSGTLIKAIFTHVQTDSSFNHVAFIDALPLGETVDAEIFQSDAVISHLNQKQPQSLMNHAYVKLEVKDEMCIYTITGIGTKNNIEISRTPKPLPEKVNDPYKMANHKIETPLAISISSDGTLRYDLDPSGKDYTIENSTDKIHILFFKILGREADIIEGEQQISVPIVVLPKEKKQVSQKQFLDGWRCAYANWFRSTYSITPQLELVSIQDMAL
jgi:hypothetical protein